MIVLIAIDCSVTISYYDDRIVSLSATVIVSLSIIMFSSVDRRSGISGTNDTTIRF